VSFMTRHNPPGHPEDLVPEVAPTAKTVLDVDDALLTEAQQLLGTIAEGDTINQALAELIRERRRLEAVESEIHRYEAGQFAALLRPGIRP
jgi:Arc/MetJ family transcription regulator